MKNVYFVSGIDTNIGKSYATGYIARKWKEVEAFLFSVFDQEKEDAFRRNRAFWGKLYLDKLAAWKEAYEHPMKRVVRLFGKKFKRK